MFCTVETKRKPLNLLKFRGFHLFAVILRGATGNRTRDTRIFSPLLYQLSYGTRLFINTLSFDWDCKGRHFFLTCKFFFKFFHFFRKNRRKNAFSEVLLRLIA